MQQKERRVCVETEDGMTVWIPESKLEAWEKADHNAPLSEEQKEMLRICAYRHAVIHFDNIAEYYAHQDKEMQNLMEENALVIIDFDRAIEKGFVDMTDKLLRLIPNKDEAETLDETEMLEGYDEE